MSAAIKVIEAIKKELDERAEYIKDLKSDIRNLKWAHDNAAEEYFNSRRRPEDEKELKRAKQLAKVSRLYRKSLVQSDTGDERDHLWNIIRANRSEIRHLTLAYGLLRGKTYVKMERECNEEPSSEDVLELIHEYLDAYNEPKDEWTLERVDELIFKDTELRERIKEKLIAKGETEDIENTVEILFIKAKNFKI